MIVDAIHHRLQLLLLGKTSLLPVGIQADVVALAADHRKIHVHIAAALPLLKIRYNVQRLIGLIRPAIGDLAVLQKIIYLLVNQVGRRVFQGIHVNGKYVFHLKGRDVDLAQRVYPYGA